MSKASVKDGSVDAGLLLLAQVTPAGRVRTQEEIAFVCGCSLQNIQHIERAAMRKLRDAFESRGVRSELLAGGLGTHSTVDYSWLYSEG